jgi:2-polyprenyl-6-methoxyphenol hydroxylase-like FAD-dependent oxidoreductase
MAGSTAAAMLAQRGIDAVMVDPHAVYPADFRCEKLDQSQLALLAKTEVGGHLLGAATVSSELWVARRGRVVDRLASRQVDAAYDTMVNAMRRGIGGSVAVILGKCAGLATTEKRQVVALAGGEEISARLVVLANGLNSALRQNLGLKRHDISPAHSIAVGFDITPRGRSRFDFRALTYYPERTDERIAYLSLFPIGGAMRANLFVYRDLRDPWLKALRDNPVPTLLAAMPGLLRVAGPFSVSSFVHVRPADLYITTGARKPGLVVVGDAYATTCPAAGTGLNRVLTDVERLVNHHIPGWLATPGMGRDKIAAFYADPVKRGTDAWSLDRAFYVRAISTEETLLWRTRRHLRSIKQHGRGMIHAIRGRLTRRGGVSAGSPVGTSGP